MWLSKNKIYIRSKSTTFPTTVNGIKVTLPTEVHHNDEIVLGFKNRYQITFTVSFNAIQPHSTAISSPHSMTLLRARNLGKNFAMKTIFFDFHNNILTGAATATNAETSSNGLFECGNLSPVHAILSNKNRKLYITDKGSDTGTFITINGKQTQLRDNVPTELLNEGATIQFGSSNRKNFIRTYCHLTEATETNDLSTEFEMPHY